MSQFDIEEFIAANCSDSMQHDDEVSVPCYNCSDEGDHLWINMDTGLFICYRCGESGNLPKFIAKVMDVSYEAAKGYIFRKIRGRAGEGLDEIKDRLDLGLEDPAPPERRKKRRALPRKMHMLPPLSPEHVSGQAAAYLRKRGVTDQQMKEHRIGYVHTGKFGRRIIVPVIRSSTSIYFVARAVLPYMQPKVLNPKNVKGRLTARDVLFNLDRGMAQPKGILVEGVFDAIATGGIALLGKRLSPTQLDLLTKTCQHWDELVVMFDNDDPDAGDKAETTARVLSPFWAVKIAELPEGEDPASVDNPERYVDAAEEHSRLRRIRMKAREL